MRWYERHSGVANAALVLGITLVLTGAYVGQVLTAPMPGGWDGISHYAMASLYGDQLFPALTGWVPEYFAGMPFPNNYPPLLFWLVGGLMQLGLSSEVAFWSVLVAATLAIPQLTLLCGARLTSSRLGALTAAAIAALFLIDGRPIAGTGITLEATFAIGLASQVVSYACLLAFLHALLAAGSSRRWAALAAVWLAAVPLSNVHMVWCAGFVFVAITGARLVTAGDRAARWRVLARHAWIGAAAVLLSACWVWPMLGRLDWVPTLALDPPTPGGVISSFLRTLAYLAIAIGAAAWRRDHDALGLFGGLVALLVFGLVPAGWLGMENLALQPARFLIGVEFLGALGIGYVVATVAMLARERWVPVAVAAGCLVLFALHMDLRLGPRNQVSDDDAAEYERVLRVLRQRPAGRVLIAMGDTGSRGFALQALAGRDGRSSLTAVYRESAVSVFFAAPLRNIISEHVETFGIDSKIEPVALREDPADALRARLALFDVRTIVVRTDDERARVEAIGGERIGGGVEWSVYAVDPPGAGEALVPRFHPVLTFARLSVKRRPDDQLDFVRLGEELFTAGDLDTPLVHAPGGIDGPIDWDRFAAALITDYRYQSVDAAAAALDRFTRRGHLIAVAADDPLYEHVVHMAATRPTIHLVGRSDDVVDAIRRVRAPVVGPQVTSVSRGRHWVRVDLDGRPAQPTPVWVRQSHYPSWRRGDGEPIYLATPMFQLTFASDRSIELRFESTGLDLAGRLGSLGGLLVLASALGREWWRRRSRNVAPR